ncbi:hypothetical protein [Acinetobacter sp. 230853]|uniref:hypothetical protein n=1 Tax=Acinetobacter sp. 230853 TaxID=1310651 RepID=UPI0004471A0D|nr:hypothetical protein [Acinetobacter sp. 230853]EXB72914.1 hypothetical protein J550_1361 [Acinetobacter sp. 230853]
MKKDIKVKIIDVFGAVSSLAVIFFFFTLWLFSYNSIDQPLKEAWTSTISFLSVLATLGTAIIATLLFNDWRDEKNFELENNLLTNILMDLRPIYVELIQIRSDSQNLGKINDFFIMKTTYIERNRLDIFKAIIILYPNIKIYSDITNDKTLIELYEKFDKYCICTDDFFKLLFLKAYKNYYDRALRHIISLGHKPLKHYDIFRFNTPFQKWNLAVEIKEVLSILQSDKLTININGISHQTKYDECLNIAIELHNKIHAYCAKHLRPKDSRNLPIKDL